MKELIRLEDISKSFSGVQALSDVNINLYEGEVHVLLGENGAGKSTLMKILTGVYTKDSGTILVDGQEVHYKSPQEAEKAGIVFIYQELNVLFDLTVEQNLFMGKEITKHFGVCDRKAMRQKAQEVMDRMGVHIPVNAVMSDLSVGQQQMVEICKALMVDAKVLIMDEPTAALTQSETEVLFQVIQSLKAKGVSIVYISHRMEEIFELCDRITILRDGEYIDTREIKDITMDDVVRMMIGREIGERYPARHVTIGDEVLRVEGLTHQKLFRDVSFSVQPGQVTALVGPSGGGKTTAASLIPRFFDVDRGSVSIGGVNVREMDTEDLMKQVAFVFQDTRLFKESLLENIRAARPEASRDEVLAAAHAAQCDDILEKLPQGLDTVVGTKGVYLSGGEQQRIALARAILKNAPIVVLDEATAFADPENEHQIQKAFEALTRNKTVLMIAHRLSTVQDADNIIVLSDGKIAEQGNHRDLLQKNGVYAAMWADYQRSAQWKVGKEAAV